MSEGEKAAEQVKGGFKGLNDISEGIRKNINSFADDLLGGNKTHESTGIHPDAKQAGTEVERGTEKLGEKLNTTPTGGASTTGTHTGSHATGAPVVGTPASQATGDSKTGPGSHLGNANRTL